jgi:hypothetical protein
MPPALNNVDSSAVISPCQRYRYELRRIFWPGPVALWVMLNPSTDDARKNDPTIVRVAGFSQRLDYAGFIVCNLFGRRATYPEDLLDPSIDPVGPDNDEYLAKAAREAAVVVCAWGANRLATERAPTVLRVLRDNAAHGVEILCMGTTAAGAPKHPLYLPNSTRAVPYVGV